MKKILLGTGITLGLLLTGCGSTGSGTTADSGTTTAPTTSTTTVTRADTPPPGEPPAPSQLSFRQEGSPPGTPETSPHDCPSNPDRPRPEGSPRSYTVPLRPGWNAVGLQCTHITDLEVPPGALGMTFFNGETYPMRPITRENCNQEDEGARRGFWVFANTRCDLRYTGVEDGRGKFLRLRRGWNMVSFALASRLNSRDLTALVPRRGGPERVPVNSVVLPQFFQISRDNGQLTIDTVSGAELEPGNCYWIFAAEPCALVWGAPEQQRPPVLEPSPRPSPVCTCSPRPDGSPRPLPSPGVRPSPEVRPSPGVRPSPLPPGTRPSPDDGNGNNGVGNGPDPQPPGDPRPNDPEGTGPGNPANQPQ